MRCIGVATTHPAEALAPYADRVVLRLDELTATKIGEWFRK